jgi:hypothetical protein
MVNKLPFINDLFCFLPNATELRGKMFVPPPKAVKGYVPRIDEKCISAPFTESIFFDHQSTRVLHNNCVRRRWVPPLDPEAKKHSVIVHSGTNPRYQRNARLPDMAEPFSRKAIAKAFFGLDVSETEPSSTVRRRCPKKSSKTKAPIQPNQKSLLLDLPVEIRLEIYDLLLVGRFNRWDNPSWSVGNTYQKLILLDFIQARQYRTMEPAVLQTCKQIYREAVPILYSRNVFRFNDPDLMLRLMVQIGYTNTKLIRSLDIYIPPRADKGSWLNLLHVLPKATTGLKSIVVRWCGEVVEKPWERSLGKDIAFAQALAGLSKVGVDKLRIEGYYAKPWPAYFRDKFGAGVVEDEDGRARPSKDDDDDWMRKLNEDALEDFRKYQNGTELLNPWEEEAGEAANPISTAPIQPAWSMAA